MKQIVLGVAFLATSLVVAGCSRSDRLLDPTQVRTINNDVGVAVQKPVLPIQGKPYAAGAQWLFDQLVKSQAGGDVESIKVDPRSVQVAFSQLVMGEGQFVMTGSAHITLARGMGEFDVHFRDGIYGGCDLQRVFATYGPAFTPPGSAYDMGFERWRAAADADESGRQSWELQDALSIFLLVREITDAGAVDMKKLQDWKQANQKAWDERTFLPAKWI